MSKILRGYTLGKDHPFIWEQVERAKGIRKGLKEDMVALYNVFAPFSSIRFGTSDEFVMRSLKEAPEALNHALSVIAQDNATLAELLVTEGGMDGIYYCVQGGEQDRFTYEEYRKMITPSDLYVLEHCNKFCCGWAGIKNRLEIWRDYPVKVINWAVFIEEVGLAPGSKFFGDKAVLGGFDNRKEGILYSGTKEDVQGFARKLVKETSIPGLLLGADCTISGDVEREI